ncbi:MAG: MFS transporter [Alphaproteobacteria bacterium]|nr:MFS transporter [Alphaproteobacteria bacterium]
MSPPLLPRLLIPRLPFFYGWVVLGCVCLAGFARQGPSVAVLSIFVTPMTEHFGWSRTAIAGAVSVGGVLAAVISPIIGPMLDRQGARLVLTLAVLFSGIACMGLSLIQSLPVFYLVFCFARMIWAGPFDLGLYGALNAWFVAHRAFVTSIATVAQLGGLIALPLIAQFAIGAGDWRDGWIAVGATVLIVGFVPSWLLLVRRPEDVGLVPDRLASAGTAATPAEPRFSRVQAMRTPAFWLLSLYTVLVYPVQAGVSLHQVPHLIERGISPLVAASVVGVFSSLSAVATIGFGYLARRGPIRYSMALAAILLAAGSLGLIWVHGAWAAYLAAGAFGMGIGGVLTLLPIAWADYFGRESYGAIRGVALSLQVLAQAVGPVLSGMLRDGSGDYVRSLIVFGTLSALAVLAALAAQRPRLAG